MSRLALALALLAAVPVAAADWPMWRGPTRDGVAPPGPLPPLTWSETKNVRWKAAVPGRGHGSPCVAGDRVFLTAAEPDAQLQSVLCFDRATGKQLWKTVVHKGGFEQTNGNAKSSFASTTPCCDGERVYATFMHGKTVTATALGLDGKQLWQTVVSPYVLHQGYGSSPAVYKNLLLVTADNKGGGVVAGLDRATGAFVWKQDRPRLPNYASPIVLTVAGKDQLVLTGCDLVSGFDPLSGSRLWETKGSTTECVTSPVTDGRLVFTSGGYPKNHVSAVAADGSGRVAWENKSRVYVPSMLVKDGHLYAVLDDGAAACWKCDTGAERWREKIGGTFSSSPVLVGDRVYATNEAGKTTVFKADPAGFEQLGEAKLGDEVLTTPAVCDGRVYTRVAVKAGGKREEFLYCLGE
ncbi:MAG: PQQ-binding-like beta-propeller repeat protein [Gemmataceae bacterium]